VRALTIAAALLVGLHQAAPTASASGQWSLVTAVAGQTATPGGAAVKTLPGEIPIFPLAEVVLFPDVSRPLLIFEPRYREMVADALKTDKIIGMVRLQPGYEKDYEGRPPTDSIGCAGVIVDYEQFPDGRYAILLRGLTTFRLLSEDQRKPYRLARVAAIEQILKDEERTALSTVRERITQQLYSVLPLGVEPPDPSLDDAQYVNVVAQALQMPEETRQRLLEQNSVLARARMLAEQLGAR
jgi:Lon protease-like protein